MANSLQAYIQKLKEQDDTNVTYSKSMEDTVNVIPPMKEEPKQKVIKQPTSYIETHKQTYKPPVQEVVQQQPVKKQKKKLKLKLDNQTIAETLFENSKTSKRFKQEWMEIYNKAQTSRKQTSEMAAMRKGKFAITSDRQLLILPDYDFRGKDSNDILNDKWI